MHTSKDKHGKRTKSFGPCIIQDSEKLTKFIEVV